MIPPDIRDLIDRLNDCMVDSIAFERRLGAHLRGASDAERVEIAVYCVDTLNGHPKLPSGAAASLDKMEHYIGQMIRQADWRLAYHALMAELDEINEINAIESPFNDGVCDPDLDTPAGIQHGETP